MMETLRKDGPRPPETEEFVLEVSDLKKYFPVQGQKDQFVKAIDGINFKLKRGETLGPGRRIRLRQEHHCVQCHWHGRDDWRAGTVSGARCQYAADKAAIRLKKGNTDCLSGSGHFSEPAAKYLRDTLTAAESPPYLQAQRICKTCSQIDGLLWSCRMSICIQVSINP